MNTYTNVILTLIFGALIGLLIQTNRLNRSKESLLTASETQKVSYANKVGNSSARIPLNLASAREEIMNVRVVDIDPNAFFRVGSSYIDYPNPKYALPVFEVGK